MNRCVPEPAPTEELGVISREHGPATEPGVPISADVALKERPCARDAVERLVSRVPQDLSVGVEVVKGLSVIGAQLAKNQTLGIGYDCHVCSLSPAYETGTSDTRRVVDPAVVGPKRHDARKSARSGFGRRLLLHLDERPVLEREYRAPGYVRPAQVSARSTSALTKASFSCEYVEKRRAPPAQAFRFSSGYAITSSGCARR